MHLYPGKEEEAHAKCYFVRPAGKKQKLQKMVNAWEKNYIFQFDNLIFTQLYMFTPDWFLSRPSGSWSMIFAFQSLGLSVLL